MGSFSYTSTGRFVIAVAGPSGAGKSTLVKELVQELEDAIALSFDDLSGFSPAQATLLKAW